MTILKYRQDIFITFVFCLACEATYFLVALGSKWCVKD